MSCFVQRVVNGVVKWVPVAGAGFYINDAMGNPLGMPGQGKNGQQGNQGNQGNQGKSRKSRKIKDSK